MSIPNVLSCFRIALIPAFSYLYLTASKPIDYLISSGILIVSGFTDVIDGFVARRFRMITSLGKVLDPLADKITLWAVCICLGIKRTEFIFVLVLFIIKEFFMMLGGFMLIRKGKKLIAAKWYGKLGTLVFYITVTLAIALPNLDVRLIYGLFSITAVVMVYAFINYTIIYKKLNQVETDS